MKNVHLLPTDKPSRLCFRNYYFINKNNIGTYSNVEFKNIYITSDEEIKEGDWVLFENSNIVRKAVDSTFTIGVNNIRIHADKKVVKIILTTDQDLIKDGVQAIDDEFLEWFVKNPSCEEVQVNLIKDSEDHPEIEGGYREEWQYYEIIIPKEEPKQETLGEVAERLFPFAKHYLEDRTTTIKRLFWVDGVKWQQERSFSEEQVIELLEYVRTNYYDTGKHWHQEPDKDISSKELFEKFKNKC